VSWSRRFEEPIELTRVVSSPPPETNLLARSCNKAERERYFVFGEFFPDYSAPVVRNAGCEREGVSVATRTT
jgi:hypothetical protein